MRNFKIQRTQNHLQDSANIGTARTRKSLGALLLLLSLTLIATATWAQNDVTDHGGPVMQTPTIFTIFWLPSGNHFDSSGASGDTTYENVMQRFFTDISGSGYTNILSQYPGVCSPPNINPSQPCFGGVTLGGSFVDTKAYPHAGSVADPLTDSDIQGEVTSFISSKGITPGLDKEFFVFTGANIQECASFSCTSSSFCAYHGDFSSNGQTVLYAFMPNDTSLSGCDETISKGPNQLSVDREIIAASHEFSESWSDPQVNDSLAWNDSISGNEIGDICVPWQSPSQLGHINSDGSNVSFNGDPYVVQEEWSNDDAACVLSDSSAITGPSIELTIPTGGDDLRGDSSATSSFINNTPATFQTVTLKSQSQPGWGNNTTHVRVFQFNQTLPPALADVAVTLTSHDSTFESQDNWNIQGMDVKLRNPNGTQLCETNLSGNPLARLTGQAPTATFATQNCAPTPPPTAFTALGITIVTGNDDARSDTELTASLPGEPGICLKPSNNADADGVCPNGGSSHDQNGNQSWNNWKTSSQKFNLANPETLAQLGTITINLIEHNSGFESDDNWDIQGIFVTGFDSSNNAFLLLSLSNPRDSHNNDNCLARLRGSPNPSSVTYNLSSSNPSGSNLSNPTFGPTPPGSCPQ